VGYPRRSRQRFSGRVAGGALRKRDAQLDRPPYRRTYPTMIAASLTRSHYLSDAWMMNGDEITKQNSRFCLRVAVLGWRPGTEGRPRRVCGRSGCGSQHGSAGSARLGTALPNPVEALEMTGQTYRKWVLRVRAFAVDGYRVPWTTRTSFMVRVPALR
jgi:hypothetical protein